MGAATVRTYVAAGATVVSMDVTEDAGRAVVEAANTAGPGSATFMRVDIADKASVDSAFDSAVAQMLGLDAVAHPAAIQRAGDAASVTVEDWDLLFAVDVRGTMLVNQAAYRHMAAQKRGSIINFGSVSGLRAEPVAPRTPRRRVPCTRGPAPRPPRGAPMGSGSTRSSRRSRRRCTTRRSAGSTKRVARPTSGRTNSPSRWARSTATPTATSVRSWSSSRRSRHASSPASCCRLTAVKPRSANAGHARFRVEGWST